MGRILAIDFGLKRTGIAVTDELQIIASGLTTVKTKKLIPFLKMYTHSESVERFVVGQPIRFSGEYSDIETDILKMITLLKKEFSSLPISRIDERFTSKIASQSIAISGLKKKKRQNKALIDEVSATIILQTFLNAI